MKKKDSYLFPTSIQHDSHDHDCGCVKCYFSKITLGPKIEFVWIIEYFLTFTIQNSYINNLRPSRRFSSSYPRSPPL